MYNVGGSSRRLNINVVATEKFCMFRRLKKCRLRNTWKKLH